MARIAVGLTEGKSKEAALKANEEFYERHPDMRGERIDPCDPKQAKYQKEWMDSYVKNGGAYRIGKYEKHCGQPVQKCPCDGRLAVSLAGRGKEGKAVSGADVAIYGPSDQQKITDVDGKAVFTGLEAGLYQVEVVLPNTLSYQDVVEVSCSNTACKDFAVDPRKMKRVPWKWIRRDFEAMQTGMSPGEATLCHSISNIILEWKMVPDDFALSQVDSKDLGFHTDAFFNATTITLCEGHYTKATAIDTVGHIGQVALKVVGGLLGGNMDLSDNEWFDGWDNYRGGDLEKYRNKTWDALAKSTK